MNGNHDQQIGRLEGTMQALKEDVGRIEEKLDEHIREESSKLDRIVQQLSLARYAWMVMKAVVLTVGFLLAFKFGDIAGLWKGLK